MGQRRGLRRHTQWVRWAALAWRVCLVTRVNDRLLPPSPCPVPTGKGALPTSRGLEPNNHAPEGSLTYYRPPPHKLQEFRRLNQLQALVCHVLAALRIVLELDSHACPLLTLWASAG